MARFLPLLAALLAGCAASAAVTIPSLPTHVSDSGPRERIRVATYNLHWRPVETGPRTEALLAELRALDADVIALQEVGAWFARALAESGFVEEGGYAAANIDGKTVMPSGLLLLSRFPIESTKTKRLANSKRSVVLSRLQVNGRRLAVADIHLSSRLNQKKLRVAQLREVLAMLGDDEALLLGDFNFGDGDEPESSTIPAAFHDAWLRSNPHDPGLTWNRKVNSWADRNSYCNEPSRRIDKILVRSTRLEPEETRLLGLSTFAEQRYPSDHFGVVTTLRDRGETIDAPLER